MISNNNRAYSLPSAAVEVVRRPTLAQVHRLYLWGQGRALYGETMEEVDQGKMLLTALKNRVPDLFQVVSDMYLMSY